ncbi:group II truncated hemoglobin [Methylovirgula sp. HY1]|uniref:group II truncated hemoglobin n=1 Tax=Methylovirgula sp. HY1 TaxID=2822761 RepID=UPI001C5B31D2|nr:group II truncated hemoglobin [Methylovirgula sp. HY1]QXX74961.1 Group 2 truncated hemoglobin GlbO [Methylovirgula sp. HY1]
MTSSSAPQVLFTEIGGQSAVDRLVDSFYHRMDTLPEATTIRAMHADDLTSVKNVLKRYLGEWLGGPKLYSQERGHPRLRQRHMHFQIGPAERDAWMLCMRGAVEEVVENTVLRGHLLQAFFKLADWVRNDSGNPHDSQH